VFIGQGIDAGTLRNQLDTCLLTTEEIELGPDAWTQWPDPLGAGHSENVTGHAAQTSTV
jgi:hypothetical protein